jgi:hypothetical protein
MFFIMFIKFNIAIYNLANYSLPGASPKIRVAY